MGRVQLVFSTTKHNLKNATPDDVKILMTSATQMSMTEVIELNLVRWQTEVIDRAARNRLDFRAHPPFDPVHVPIIA